MSGFSMARAVATLSVVVLLLAPTPDRAAEGRPLGDPRGVASGEHTRRTERRTLGAQGARPAPPSERVLARPMVLPPDPVPSGGLLRLDRHHGLFGSALGRAGLALADLDLDGSPEIVAGSRGNSVANNRWFIASYDGEEVTQDWATLPYPQNLTALRVAQVDGDPAPEVLVAVYNEILVYDGASRALEHTFSWTPYSPRPGGLRAMRVRDVDDDGQIEVVATDWDDLFIFDLATGVEEYRGVDLGGSDVALGEIDGEPGLEIVVGRGRGYKRPGHVVSALTRTVEWVHEDGFGDRLETADVDGDGLDEIVCGFGTNGTYAVEVWEGDTRTRRYQVPDVLVTAVGVADIDANGSLEVVWGGRELKIGETWGEVHVIDGATGADQWWVEFPESTIHNLAVHDVDADGRVEIVFGTSGHVYVVDTVSRAVEARTEDLPGPLFALDHGDVDADGAGELVWGSFSRKDYGDSLYQVRDPRSWSLEYQSSEISPDHRTMPIRRIAMEDVDAAPQLEMFIAGDDRLVCVDGLDHSLKWHAEAGRGLDYRSLQLGDLDRDGRTEVVVATGTAATPTDDRGIEVYDAETGSLVWKSPALAAGVVHFTLLRIANVDADPQLEIVVASTPSEPDAPTGNTTRTLLVVDPVTRAVELAVDGLPVSALDTVDAEGDGVSQIIVGTDSGSLLLLDSSGGTTSLASVALGAPIDGLAAADVVGDEAWDYVFGVDGRVGVVDGTSGRLAYLGGQLGEWLGAHDTLRVADVDADTHLEIVATAGTGGLWVLEVDAVHEPALSAPVLDQPAPGQWVSGLFAQIAVYTEDPSAVERVELYVDGLLRREMTGASGSMWRTSWNTTGDLDGPHEVEALAHGVLGSVASTGTVTVFVDNRTGDALYDSEFKTASCRVPAPYCFSDYHLRGRGMVRPEPARPGTIGASCPDGDAGVYGADESGEGIRVRTQDNTRLAAGKRVTIEAWYYAAPSPRSGGGGGPYQRAMQDRLYLFSAADARDPDWVLIGVYTPTAPGPGVIAAEFTLPEGDLQAIRAAFRVKGSATPCLWGPFTDHDDLVFAVE